MKLFEFFDVLSLLLLTWFGVDFAIRLAWRLVDLLDSTTMSGSTAFANAFFEATEDSMTRFPGPLVILALAWVLT